MGVFRILPTNIAGLYYISMKLRGEQLVPCSVCACERTDWDAAAAQHSSIQLYPTVPLWECSRLPTNSVLPVQAAHIRRLNGMLASEHSPILMPVIILQRS